VKIFLLQATILLMCLLQAASMVVPCGVFQVNIHHLDLQVPDRLLVQLLFGLLRRLLLVRLVLEVLLVTGIGIIGWDGMGWISHLLLLGMIDHLLLLDIMVEIDHPLLLDFMVEAAALAMDVETHVTEVDMADPEKKSFLFQSNFFLRYLILLAHLCFIFIFISLQTRPCRPICYLSSGDFCVLPI